MADGEIELKPSDAPPWRAISSAATTKPWIPIAKYAAMRIAEGAGATSSVANAVTAARTAIATVAATKSTVTTTAMKTNPMANERECRNRRQAAEPRLAPEP